MTEPARITITLDPPFRVHNPLDGKRTRPAWQAGDELVGLARVEILEDLRTDAIRARLARVVAGSRHVETAYVWDEVFYRGRLEAGNDLNLAIRAVVPPAGPISYEGKLFKIYWEVEALIELAYQLDPKAIEPVAVLPRNWRQASMSSHLGCWQVRSV